MAVTKLCDAFKFPVNTNWQHKLSAHASTLHFNIHVAECVVDLWLEALSCLRFGLRGLRNAHSSTSQAEPAVNSQNKRVSLSTTQKENA